MRRNQSVVTTENESPANHARKFQIGKYLLERRMQIVITGFTGICCLLFFSGILKHCTSAYNMYRGPSLDSLSRNSWMNRREARIVQLANLPHFHRRQVGEVAKLSSKPEPLFTQGLALLPKHRNVRENVDRTYSTMENCGTENLLECLTQILSENFYVFESSGGYGNSFVRRLGNLQTGQSDLEVRLPTKYFAEGLATSESGGLYLGTWRERKLLEMDLNMNLVKEYNVANPKEVWGLASDTENKILYATDGTTKLHTFPLPLEVKSITGTNGQEGSWITSNSTIDLKCNGKPLHFINALTIHPTKKTLWANQWYSDVVYELDPLSGQCINSIKIDIYDESMNPNGRDSNTCWNGLVFLSPNILLLTGKLFMKMYIVKLYL